MASCSQEPTPVAVTSLTLDSTSIILVEGDSQTLTATILPSNAENQKVIWTSSNSSVATVNNGVVTALIPGISNVSARSDDGGHIATCQVSVIAKVYSVTSISLDKTSAEITEGDEVTLVATITPENATDKNVTWSSNNTEVAVVDKNGKVTALKPGQATITVTSEDGGNTATCEVIVNIRIYLVESINLNKSTATMLVGDKMKLEATINPSNATNKNISWSSSNPSVVSVDNGQVQAHQLGSATITATTEDGNKTASCVISVVNIDSIVKAAFRNVSFTNGGSMSFEGSYIKLTSGTKVGVALNNYSSKTITLTGLSLICGKTDRSVNYSIQTTEGPQESSIGYTIQLTYTIYAPIVEFTYQYNSETYKVRAQYNGSF